MHCKSIRQQRICMILTTKITKILLIPTLELLSTCHHNVNPIGIPILVLRLATKADHELRNWLLLLCFKGIPRHYSPKLRQRSHFILYRSHILASSNCDPDGYHVVHRTLGHYCLQTYKLKL